MISKFDAVVIAAIGLLLLCMSAIYFVWNMHYDAATLFVGGIIFTVFGYVFWEMKRKEEVKIRKK
jgi:heme O synthase-like polyprenyltransferase